MIPSIEQQSGFMPIQDHRLSGATHLDSPNQNERPSAEISLVVIHGISLPPGEFGGNAIEQLFMNTLDTSQPGLANLEGVRVSSHLLIRRTGEVLQFVAFDRRAWHAGVSSFDGRENCNDFSVGIELEGTDTTPYEDAQYWALADTCKELMTVYGATEIRGHADIAPGRKTDPGPAFDWLKLQVQLAGLL